MRASASRVASPHSLPRQGEIRSSTIPHLIHDLSAAGLTGSLNVTDRDIRKTVQFTKGTLLFASSTDRDDRLGQILLRSGEVSLPKLLKALELALATKDRLGEVMVRLKMTTMAEVEKWVKIQVQEIIYSIFQWTRGQYVFEEKPPGAESITLGTPGAVAVIEGVRRTTSWARAYEEVGGLSTEYRTTKDMPMIVRALPLVSEERALLDLCDTPMSLGELCEASKMSGYDVCKSIWALWIVGALMKS